MKIAILGARGLIGKTFIRLLEENNLKNNEQNEIECFGSINSQISFNGKTLLVKELNTFNPLNYDFIFSALDDETTKQLYPIIEKSGKLWIDKSSAMRMDANIPLIVPEVNIEQCKDKKIISSPNCVAIPTAVFLKSIEKFEPEFVNITTYQSVSGAGYKALDAFFKEVKSFDINPLKKGLIQEHPMAFNVIPSIGEINEEGNCDEEIKITQELKKILNNQELCITATCMRVSTTISHLISLNFKLKQEAKTEQIINKMKKFNIIYSENLITPIMAAHENTVFACRLRYHGLKTWSVILICDNLRKGGALNALEIAQHIFNSI